MKQFKKAKPWKKNKKNFVTGKIFSFSLLLLIVFSYIIIQVDKKILPSIIAMSNLITQNKVNQVINFSVSKVVEDLNLNSSDFYKKGLAETGNPNSFSINTILVNDFCNKVSVNISNQLDLMGDEKISIPIGTLFSIGLLSNFGPKYYVRILPMGTSSVEYESSFESVGINQVNFQIWLKIDSEVQIVNPLQKEKITVSRKVSLVNTVMSGEVPPAYLNLQK